MLVVCLLAVGAGVSVSGAVYRLALWAVARACLNREPLRPIGERLADTAVAAAASQGDTAWLLAILRERGEIALQRGEVAGVVAQWVSR